MNKKYFLVVALFVTLSLFSQPANDDCANAEVINITTSSTSIPFDINTATINNEIGCAGTSAADYADVWHSFTMPFNGNVYVNGSISWNKFALYDTCGGTEIQCGSANELFTNLSSGTTYILRVYRTASHASNTGYQSFSIQAFQEVTNDDCASAENIAVTTSTSTVNFEIGGATINDEVGCSGTTTQEYADIWYDFTMPFNGNVYVDGSISWNSFALYDSCGGTEIQCGTANELFTELTSGMNYKLRVFRTRGNTDNGYLSFTIKAFQEVTNDDCASAENIAVTTSTSTVNFEIGGATINDEVGCTGTTAQEYADIWYDFTMPVNGNVYVDGSIGWNSFALYDSCGGTEIQCGTANELFTELTSGVNYKLRVFRTRGNTDNGYLSFTIKAFQEVANDDCTSTENIAVTTEASTVNFEIGGASINNEVGCYENSAQEYADVWYDFTMPVNGNLFVDASINWNLIALYDACNGTEIHCGAGSELITGLTATTNYKLRIFRTRGNADNNYLGFTIQAFEIINNDDCASAENITVTNTPTTVNFGIGGASINNEVGCSGNPAQDYADIWYEFTMPIDGFIVIDGTLAWNNFALYDACSGSELGCFSDSGDFSGLTNGILYKLRVFRALAFTDNQAYKSFTIHSTETLSTNNSTLENNIQVYPNPAQDVLNISISENHTIKSITLFNMLGKKMVTTKANTIDVSSFQTGIYLLKVETEKGQITKRVVIQ